MGRGSPRPEQPLGRGSALSRLGAELELRRSGMSIESVMSSNHLILCLPLLLLLSISPSIRVFPNELALHINGAGAEYVGERSGEPWRGRSRAPTGLAAPRPLFDLGRRRSG